MAEPTASKFGTQHEAELAQRSEQTQQLILAELKAVRALLERNVEADAMFVERGLIPREVLPPRVAPDCASDPAGFGGRACFDRLLPVADGANADGADEPQDGLLLADIEARLTDEVRRLISSLDQFARRAQLIGVEIPDSAHFCKSVTSLLALLGFQLAYSFGKGLDVPVFFDDGAEYLRKLNLSLGDFVRELTLDGRRFLAVALVDEQLDQLRCSADRSDKC